MTTPVKKLPPKQNPIISKAEPPPPFPPKLRDTPAPKNFGMTDAANQLSGARKRYAKGGSACGTKKYAKGGVTRADGCCIKGHTKGKMV